jgi:hypothetical protein
MPNRVTSLLISHGETHQLDAVLRADRAANSVQLVVARGRRRIERIIGASHNWIELYQGCRVALHRLPDLIRERLHEHLREMVLWSHRRTLRTLKKTLPLDYLRAAAKHKIEHQSFLKQRRGLLTEDQPSSFAPPTSGGIIDLALTALGLKPTDYADPLREPARSELSIERQRDIFTKLLFPPPPEHWVQRVLTTTLQHQTWYQALDSNIRKAEFGPEWIANLVATDYALGKTQKEITEHIKPSFDGLGWRAARTARTFGLAIAGQTQQAMHEQLGDLEIAKMIRATLDERTRRLHRLRNGTVYYREPMEGRLGYDAMPNPPLEADGSLAWN